jgi:phage-related protein
MAISKDQLTVEVVLDSSGAIKGIKDLEGQFVEFDKIVAKSSKTTDKAAQSTGKVGDAFSSLSGTLSRAALPLLAVQAAVTAVTQVFGTLSNTLGSFVNDFAAAERAQILLTQAIENSGGRIQNTAAAWGNYLDQLQEVKAVDADVLRGLVAQAVQMGFSEKQIKSLVEASIGLSKVTGDSLDASFQKLIGTTRGMARSLTAMIPELQNLTEDQLRAGDAFAIVASKYKSAADGAGSYTYAVKQAGLAAGELSEDVGRLIVESLNLKGAMETVTSVINGVRNAIAAVDVNNLSARFKEFLIVAGPIAATLLAVTAYMKGFAAAALAAAAPIAIASAKIIAITTAVLAAIAAIEIIVRNLDKLGQAFKLIGQSILVVVLKPIELLQRALAKFFSLFGDNALARNMEEGFKQIGKEIDKLTSDISANYTNLKDNLDTGFTGEAIKQGMNFIKGFGGETKKADASLKALGETGARVKVINEEQLKKAEQILRDIQKMTDQMRMEATSAGATELQQIDLKLKAQMKTIDEREKELATIKGISAAQKKAQTEALTDARIAAVQQAEAARQALATKNFTDLQAGAMKELESLMQNTNSLENANRLSKLEGVDLIRAQYEIEEQKIAAIEEQLSLTGKLGEEQQKQIERARAALGQGKDIASGKAQEQQAQKTADIYSGVISSAAGGADAVVGNAITQLGKAFGPEGQLIASAINILRLGGDFMKTLGSELIKIIIELPLKLAEGVVGLVEGLLDGIINMLSDPAKLAKIQTSFMTLGPKIITSIAKALPSLLKTLLDPGFWMEFAKQFIRSIFEALKQMVYAVGDLIASIFNGDIFSGVGDAVESMGNAIGDGIKDATKAVTGFTEQLFGVQEDTAGQAQKDQGDPIKKAFDYGAKKTKSIWRDIMKFVVDTFNLIKQLIIAPFEFMFLTVKETMKLLSSILEGGMVLFAALAESLIMTVQAAGNILSSVFSTIWDSAKIVFEGIVNLFSSLWSSFKNIFMAVFNFARSIFQGVIDAFKAVFTFFRNVFDDPIGALKQFLTDFKNIFANIWDAFKEIPMKLWDGIKNGVSVVWDTFKQLGGRIWEGLKDVFGEIGTWFKGVGTKIYDGFAEMFGKIADGFRNFGRNIWEGFKSIIRETVGRLADWLGLAEGGIVPGTAKVAGDSGKNDVVPALLSPGEAVIPRSLMANPEINKMIMDLLNNRQMPVSSEMGLPRVAFANGGMVPALAGGGGTVFGDTNVNVVMKIDSKEPIDEAFLRQRLVPALKAELKASSLRGDFVLSAKGVRS